MTILILVDTGNLVNWQGELIHAIHRHHRFNVCLLNVSQLDWWTTTRNSYSDQLMRGFISRFLDFKHADRDAFERIDINTILTGDSPVEVVDWNTDKLPASDLAINLSPLVDEKYCAESMGVSVWGLRFGKGAEIDSPLASAYEILASQPTTSLRVIETKPGEEGRSTVYKAESMTLNYSTRLNAGQLAWKVVECVPRLLEKRSVPPVESDHRELSILEGEVSPFQKVNSEALRLPASFPRWMWARFSKKARKKFFVEQWVLLTGKQTSSLMPDTLTTIQPPVDRIWADPFGIRRENKVFVFFEDMSLKTWRGQISCAELYKDGSFSEVKTVLQRNYHLSYPFLMEEEGELYMIPETGENRSIEVYRCRSFPDQWEYAGNLMSDIEAYDTTIFKHKGYWWLFTLVAPVKGMSTYDQLHLYYAKEFPSDTWTPHPANPIIDDARLARPAGYLFTLGNKLIRPSQDSSRRYGRGLNFNEVIEISTESYKEVLLEKHLASETSRKLRAMHTINHCGTISFLDAQVLRPKSKKNIRGTVIRPL